MTFSTPGILNLVALTCAAGATGILVWYLLARPALKTHAKLWLFLGLGPLPIGAALAGNGANFEETKERRFCASCHVMTPYAEDAASADSRTLASLHSKSPWFGHESCYVCHADYGMFGTVTTKLGGMRHVWDFYTNDWTTGERKPELYKPYSNATCNECHPRDKPGAPMEHQVHKAAIASDEVNCYSSGCHGPVHPSQMESEPALAEAKP